MHISTEGSGMPSMTPKTSSPSRVLGQGVHVGRRGGGGLKMHISTEGSGMPSMTPKTSSPSRVLGQGVHVGRRGGGDLKCTYLLKVQACPS